MKRVLPLFLLTLLFVQCGNRKALPAGAPSPLKTKALLDSIARAENKPVVLQFRASARLSSPALNQNFKLEVRLLPDSLIWLDFADPILGVKAARAVVYPDSVAFVNKLKREYLTGNIAAFQRTFQFDFDFFDLQAILLGNLTPRDLERFEQYPAIGLYQLANFEQDPEKQQSVSPLQEAFVQLYFDPETFKPTAQEQNEPVNGKRYSLLYADFQHQGGVTFPQRVKVEYAASAVSTLELNVQQLQVNKRVNFPFSIPSGYARLK